VSRLPAAADVVGSLRGVRYKLAENIAAAIQCVGAIRRGVKPVFTRCKGYRGRPRYRNRVLVKAQEIAARRLYHGSTAAGSDAGSAVAVRYASPDVIAGRHGIEGGVGLHVEQNAEDRGGYSTGKR